MNLSTQIARHFREVHLNGHWVARTNIKEQIMAIDWEEATTQVSSLNPIALLIFHIDYYLAGLIKVFEGGPLDMRDKYSFDMPPVQSQTDWEQLRDRFCKHAERFAELVEQMSDEQIMAPFVVEKYGNYYRNIQAMIEHSYYHMGQMVIIRKLIGEQASQA